MMTPLIPQPNSHVRYAVWQAHDPMQRFGSWTMLHREGSPATFTHTTIVCRQDVMPCLKHVEGEFVTECSTKYAYSRSYGEYNWWHFFHSCPLFSGHGTHTKIVPWSAGNAFLLSSSVVVNSVWVPLQAPRSRLVAVLQRLPQAKTLESACDALLGVGPAKKVQTIWMPPRLVMPSLDKWSSLCLHYYNCAYRNPCPFCNGNETKCAQWLKRVDQLLHFLAACLPPYHRSTLVNL